MILFASIGAIQRYAALAMVLGMTATVGTALGFEHVGGYLPCALCLEQRTPYYLGIPLMGLAALAAFRAMPPALVRGLLLAGALVMTWSLVLAARHAGVEWGWWAGPADCGVIIAPMTGGGLLDALDSVVPPACDQASWRLLGLSFAGWNAVASLVLGGIGYYGAFARAPR